MLSPESSPEPGRWNTERTPYLRDIMDALNDARVETIVFIKSSQVGASESLLNMMGYLIDYDTCPVLSILPTLQLAMDFSKDRLAAMIRDTPALRGKVSDAKSRDGDNTKLRKKFPGGYIVLAGANSPSSLASRPIRVVLCDEVDRYPVSAGAEGDPVKLAKKRTTTFWNRKEVLTSTPTIKGASRIEDAYELSDKRRFFVPCPQCGHRQHLRWPQVKWDSKAVVKIEGSKGVTLKTPAWYECEKCNSRIEERQKLGMLKVGAWVAEHPEVRKTAGFHINELYSPWVTWTNVVEGFLEAKEHPEKLRVWVNTSLGETFEIRGEDGPEWRRLYDRREPYPVGIVPAEASLLTGAADVQKDRIEVQLMAWSRRESWVVDYIVIVGDTFSEAPWRDLDALLARQWTHASGGSVSVKTFAIDTGYNTNRVYEWVRGKNPRQVMAIKGRDDTPTPVGTPRLMDVNIRGKKIFRGVRLWPVGVSVLKSELYGRLKMQKPTDTDLKEFGYPKDYIHFPQLTEEFFRGLVAEQFVAKKTRTGHVEFEWVKTYPRNEPLDLTVYNMAAFHALGAHRWKEDRWRMEESAAGACAPTDMAATTVIVSQPSVAAPTAAPAKHAPRETAPRGRRSSFW
jgi:phage terminase large subunit GpA-like protein